MIYHANVYSQKAGVAISISDKVDFRAKKITRDKKGTLLPRKKDHMLIFWTIKQTFKN